MLNHPKKVKISAITDVLDIDNIENIDQRKKVTPSKHEKRSLIISSSFISKDLFCESLFIIQYILKNKIMAIILANTYATRYGFINEEFAKIDC